MEKSITEIHKMLTLLSKSENVLNTKAKVMKRPAPDVEEGNSLSIMPTVTETFGPASKSARVCFFLVHLFSFSVYFNI